MADTLESIFQATSLGATQLDDGEHTLVTTDANTSFVIKDMHVNGTSSLTNTHLELNGFNVSSITANATGSLIIPPSSTLKLKSTDYPYQFNKLTEWAITSSDFGYKESYTDPNGNAQGTPYEYYNSSSLSYYHDIIDVQRTQQVGGAANMYLHYSTNDNNSVQRLHYINTSDNSTSVQVNQNYDPIGLENNKAYCLTGSTAQEIDLAANPTSGNFVTSNFGGQKSNSYNPNTTSSYPRGRAAHGFFFYVQSSAHYDLWGINLSNGCWHKFETGTAQQWQLSSNSGNFVVSIDHANDKMYLYANKNNQTQHIQWVFDNWSSIQALDTSTQNTHNYSSVAVNSSHTQGSGGNHNTSSGMSKSNMGYDSSGGFYYQNTSQQRVHVDKSWNVVGTNVSTLTVSNTSINNPANGFVANEDKLSNAEASALSLTAPTFGIQLLGVKSTT